MRYSKIERNGVDDLQTIDTLSGQYAIFQDEADIELVAPGADGVGIHAHLGLFGGEDGFPCSYEGQHFINPAIRKCNFGDGEFEERERAGCHVGGIFEVDGQAVGVGFVRQSMQYKPTGQRKSMGHGD